MTPKRVIASLLIRPVVQQRYWLVRVTLFEIAELIGRCISAKAKYLTETDSAQVVRTKDEKYFGKRVT